jgi:hypothetical protein
MIICNIWKDCISFVIDDLCMIYTSTHTTRLRLIDNDDLNFLLELRSDPEIIDNLSSFVFLNTSSQTHLLQISLRDSKTITINWIERQYA